ncbi:hypothetical protein ABZ756_02600 [Mammaliicoccus sciuri]|uniref:hypothetical protein n=1 Tax=Sporosarcina newyorkensis TaxID=759851 RepID=UPI00349AD937
MKLKMISKIQEEYKKSKLFFVIKALLSVTTIYFAIRVLIISTSGLSNSDPIPEKLNLLLFGMLFSLGLSSIVKIVEMFIYKQKEYFTLQVVSTIFILGVSIYLLFM